MHGRARTDLQPCRPHLHRLPEAHVVGEDALEAEALQECEPRDAVALVAAQRHAARQHRRHKVRNRVGVEKLLQEGLVGAALGAQRWIEAGELRRGHLGRHGQHRDQAAKRRGRSSPHTEVGIRHEAHRRHRQQTGVRQQCQREAVRGAQKVCQQRHRRPSLRC